jgi:hypothetical protein
MKNSKHSLKSDVALKHEARKLNLLCRAQDLEIKKREAFFETLRDVLCSEGFPSNILQDARWFITQKNNPFAQPEGTSAEDLEQIFSESFTDEGEGNFQWDEILPFEQSETMSELSLALEFTENQFPKPSNIKS